MDLQGSLTNIGENSAKMFKADKNAGCHCRRSVDQRATGKVEALGIHSRTLEPSTTAKEFVDHWSIAVGFGSIQPRMKSWASRPVFVGATRSGDFSLSLAISTDNLPEPTVVCLETHFDAQLLEPLTQDIVEEIWYQIKSREWASENKSKPDEDRE